MKRLVAILCLLPAAAFAKQLTILHTNDIHSHIGRFGPNGKWGGEDRIAKLIGDIEAKTPNVVLLDAGDWIEGTFYFRMNQPASVAPFEWAGTTDLHMMEIMNYDATVMGNHDYIDYNRTQYNGSPFPYTVLERFQRAGKSYPILSYNFKSSAIPALDQYLVDQGDPQPFVVLDVNGVRIAMAGMTEELFVYQMYLADSVLDDPGGGYAQPVIDQMNALNPPPDVTMLLNHVGHGDDQDIAAHTHGLDLIVGGHSHTRLFNVDMVQNDATPPKPVIIVQAGSKGMFLGRLDLDINDTTSDVTVDSYGLIPVDQNVAADPTIGAEVDRLRTDVLKKHGNVFSDQVASIDVDIKGGSRESSVGNLLADAILWKAAPQGAQMAWISNGAVSNPGEPFQNGLRPGNITSEDVYRIYGHGYNPQIDKNFRIFLVDYKGSDLRWLQETFNFGDLVASLGEGLFINIAGGQITYDPTLPTSSRITSFTVGGSPIIDTQTYTIALGEGELQVLDYLTSLGWITFNYTNLRLEGSEVWQTLRDYLAANDPVPKKLADVDGRFRTVGQDLAVENYDIAVNPPTWKPGDTVSIDVTVENVGATASTGGSLEVYADATPFQQLDDPNYNSGTLIGTVPIPPIQAFPFKTTLSIPWNTTGVAPGTVPIYALITGVSEQNPTNQFAFRYLTGMTVPTRFLAGPGPGPQNPPTVHVLKGLGTPETNASFAAFGATGYGVNLAAGDLDGAGATDDEILAGAGPGAVYGPQFRAFHLDGTPLGKVNGYAYGTLRYGLNVAAPNLDADGYAEILMGPGPGAVFGPHVRAFNFDGATLSPIARVNFFAYGTLKWGVNVARAELDADGFDEILTTPGPGVVFAAQVRGFQYDGTVVQSMAKLNFNAMATHYGARAAAGDVDADGYQELLIGPGEDPTASAQVRGYDFDGSRVTAIPGVNFVAYQSYRYGSRPAAGDIDADGSAEILVSPGPDPSAEARCRGYDTAPLKKRSDLDFLLFDPEKYGVNVAVAALRP